MRYAAVAVLCVCGALAGCGAFHSRAKPVTPPPVADQPGSQAVANRAQPVADDGASPSAPAPVADQTESAPRSDQASSPTNSTKAGPKTNPAPTSKPSVATAPNSRSQSAVASSSAPTSDTTSRNAGSSSATTAAAGKSVAPPPSAPPPPPAAQATPAPSSAVPQPAALDLAGLEQRLKDTAAIGLFSKLSLKNQVDDLLGQFRTFHGGKVPPTLSQLRQKYDVLLMKVLSLLQDGDPALAQAISTSREALWGILSDPQKFAKL